MSDMKYETKNESIPGHVRAGRPTLIDKNYGEYVTVHEAARRLGCSKRHVERIIACNDPKKLGVARVGRRVVRLHWSTFEKALLTGTVRS